MSYSFPNQSHISKELEKSIRKIHAIAKNAITDGRYIIFGVGSTQLLNAAVHALSVENSSSPLPAKVVAQIPYYRVRDLLYDTYLHNLKVLIILSLKYVTPSDPFSIYVGGI